MGYLWEPFNPRHRPGTFPIRFPHYFHYVCAENGAGLVGPIADALAFRYRPGAELHSLRSARDAKKKRHLGRPAILFEGHARNMRDMMGLRGVHPGKIRHDRDLRATAAAKAATEATEPK